LPVPAVTQVDRIRDRDHIVQFYNNDDTLIDRSRGTSRSVAKRDVAVLIANREHRHAVEARPRDMGFDVEALRQTGDVRRPGHAESLHGRGRPDAYRFRALLGTWMDAALGEATGVRAFGEMVALLHQNGIEAATIELERLWNELGIVYELTAPTPRASSPADIKPSASPRSALSTPASSAALPDVRF
jgi:hypothetical protein